MTIFRWILASVLTLCLVLAMAAILLPRWFDPNDYRAEIAQQISQATGREVALNGELSLSVFPWIGVRTQALTVSQPRQIGGDFVSVDTAQIRLKLLPLLSQRAEIDTVYLRAPEIRFVSVSDDLNSMSPDEPLSEDSTPGESSTAQAVNGTRSSESSSQANSQSSPESNFEVVLAGVEIVDGSMILEDRQAASVTRITNIDASFGQVLAEQPAAFEISGRLSAKAADEPPTQFNANGLLSIVDQGATVTINSLRAELQNLSDEVAIQINEVSISEFDQFKLQATKAQLVTDSLSSKLDLDIPMLTYLLTKDSLNIPRLEGVLAETRVELLNVSILDLSESLRFEAELNVPEHALIKSLGSLNIDYEPSNSAALKAVALNGKVKGTAQSVSLQDASLQLDSSQIELSGRVKDFENPLISLRMNADRLTLDDYMPRNSDAKSGELSSPDGESLAAALAVPMAVFEGFNAEGELSVGKLIASGVELSNVRLDIKSDGDAVVIQPKAELFEGSLGGDIAYSKQSGVPTLRVKNEIDLVSIGELLSSVQITDQLSGIGSMALDLVITERDGKQFNEGTIKLFAKQGALTGIDVQQVLETSYQQYKRLQGQLKKTPASNDNTADTVADTTSNTNIPDTPATGESSEADETRFGNLVATLNLKDFQITNTDFRLSAPYFEISGAGLIDLAAEKLDYTVSVAVANLLGGEASEALTKLQGIAVPIRFSGNLRAPNYSVDTRVLYQNLLRQDLQAKKAALIEKKLGIEGTEKLSTKETLKEVIRKELFKPKTSTQNTSKERPMVTPSSGSTPAESSERPIGERAEQDTLEVRDAEEANSGEGEPLDKDALKQAIGEKLLEELFK